jgi:hypothetical protein
MTRNEAVKICHSIVVDKEAGRELTSNCSVHFHPFHHPARPQNPPSTVRNAIERAFH